MTDSKDVAADNETDETKNADPVRRVTLILLTVIVLLVIWYLRADRVTPYTSQARVHALVVPIAPEVSGTVTSVAVSNNQRVEAGQVLFQIDVENYQMAVDNAEATLELARQNQGVSNANVEAARAQLATAEANQKKAEQDAVRMRNIRDEDPGAISQRRIDSAESNLAASVGRVEGARANLEKAIQALGAEGDDNSSIQQALVAVDQAKLNLQRATVRAPTDGVVTDVRLDKGNFAAAGHPQLTFISTRDVWIQADYTENNLGNIDVGDEVAVVFDVLPGKVIKGRVREIGFGVSVDSAPLGSLPTINNDKNWLRDAQRYPVLVEFDITDANDRRHLKVGSQVSVIVFTGEHWLFNALARFHIWLVSKLTYAY